MPHMDRAVVDSRGPGRNPAEIGFRDGRRCGLYYSVMVSRLPDSVLPARLADRGVELAGEIPLRGMRRLGASVLSTEGAVAIKLAFSRDEKGLRYVSGTVAARLSLRCQRCLEPMEVPIVGRVALGVVESEVEGNRLPPELEPLLVGPDPLSLVELVEDELILALPLVPLHPFPCRDPEDQMPQQSPVSASPFEALRALKRGSSRQD